MNPIGNSSQSIFLNSLFLLLIFIFSSSIQAESFGFQEKQRNSGVGYSGTKGDLIQNTDRKRNKADGNNPTLPIANENDSINFNTRHRTNKNYEPMFQIPVASPYAQKVTDEDLIYAQENRGKPENREEDWEAELDKELEDLEKRGNMFEGSRGFTSPTQVDPLTGDRSTQNLMMDVTAAVDMVGSWDNNRPQTTSNGFDVREAEFGFFGAIDQWGRGTFLAAAHNENGKYMFEVHEANIIFPFISRYVNLKLGRMFLDWGRLNRIHRHDWPFTMAPIIHQKLMDKEAVADTGGELSFLNPFFEKFTQELVLGVTNGRQWGHSHNAGQNKNNPMAYAHLKNFYYFGDNWGTQFGGTVIRYEPDPDSNAERRQYGLDAVLRWNRGNQRSFMIMSELWYRENRFPDVRNPDTFENEPVPMDTQWGYYIFVEYQFHQLWLVGYRYDFFNVPNLRNSRGDYARNALEANTFQITFRPSEFSFIRASAERRYNADFSSSSEPEFIDYRYYIQVTYLMGSHPAHQY
jgi:hypothetical protein